MAAPAIAREVPSATRSAALESWSTHATYRFLAPGTTGIHCILLVNMSGQEISHAAVVAEMCEEVGQAVP